MNDFFQNASRYPRFLISITLGIFLVVFKPLIPLFQRPSTAIALTTAIAATFAFLFFTLRAMLGLGTL